MKPVRVAAAALIIAVGIGIVVFAFGGDVTEQRDFLSYWAAGQQLVHHGNPYGDGVFALEKSVGDPASRPIFMRNPPTAFFLVLPLGFVSMKVGSILWTLAMLGCLMISIRLLWILQGRPNDRLFMVAYLFVPVIPCMHQGQTAIFILLGLVLFLYFRESMPLVAGAALLLPSLKPHLFLPFAVVLLGWVITRKAYRVLTGFVAALISSGLFSYFLDPLGWMQYREMMRSEQIGHEFIPTLSLVFRYAIHKDAVWLQFVPAAIGCAWAGWYFLKHRDDWNWNSNGNVVLLVSVMVTPYAWLPDECVVLPAIIAGLYLASRKMLIAFCAITAIAIMELAANLYINSGAFIWTSSAWLIWYLCSVNKPRITRSARAALDRTYVHESR